MRVRQALGALGSRWSLAVLAAISTGSLLGIALGARSWPFFAGCGAGALLAILGFKGLRREEHSPESRSPEAGENLAEPPRYDLGRDRSTDNQRWPM
jgi:hypothetical protein